MSWRDLLQTAQETLVLPWVGGKTLQDDGGQTWSLQGPRPQDFGWYRFEVNGRKAKLLEAVDPEPETLRYVMTGYLVGDRLVPDGARIDPDPRNIHRAAERVHLIEEGLDRFARISAGRIFEEGPLVFRNLEMPLGPEDAVLNAYLDQLPSVDAIPGVTPALDAAFRMETHQRVEAERRRLEAERRRQEEEERLRREEQRRKLFEQLGDGAGRRAMAAVDFVQAARAALAVGGAEYLDSRRSNRGEMVVKFRLGGQRFECVCDSRTLTIVDAGICLTAHYDDPDFESGTKGDTWLTLESLPSVIRQAEAEGKLVIFRHVY